MTYTSAQVPLPATKITPNQVWELHLLQKAGVTNPSGALEQVVQDVISNRQSLGETWLSSQTLVGGTKFVPRLCINAFQNAAAQAQQSGTQFVFQATSMACGMTSADANYYSGAQGYTVPQFSFPPGGEIVVVGINHGTLGSATYSNLTIQNDVQYFSGRTNVDLNGSAVPFLGSLPASVGSDFYVATFNDSCSQTDPYCQIAPANTLIGIAERLYLSPITATMPDYTDVVPSVLMVFSAPAATPASN